MSRNAVATVANQQIEKWAGWIGDTIKSNVFTMYLQRDAWQEVAKMLQENSENLPDSYWWQFMVDTYGHTQVMAVRRQADTRRGSASLGKLLTEIAAHPQDLTRTRWFGLDERDAYWMQVAEEVWSELYAGEVGEHLDPAIPAADFKRLRAAAKKAKDFADKHVAHSTASAVSAAATVTFEEVHEAISVIGELFVKYDGLLLDSGWSADALVPAIQHNWKAIFREPWMAPLPFEPEP